MNRSAMLRAAAVAAAVAAGACAREESPPAGVAARVNGGEMPARRIDREMPRERRDARPDLHEATSRAVESAIDQKLLVQKAIEAGLDRDPDVMRELDEGRRRVLANAWVRRSLAERAHAERESEVRAFYAANPALFAQRRIYTLREILVSGPAATLQGVAAAAHAGSAKDVEAAIAHAGLQARARESTQPAEDVPLALLAKLQSMKDGEITAVDSAGALAVVELLRAVPAPLGEREAAPAIERYLATRHRPANASIQARFDARSPRGLAVSAVSEEDEPS